MKRCLMEIHKKQTTFKNQYIGKTKKSIVKKVNENHQLDDLKLREQVYK